MRRAAVLAAVVGALVVVSPAAAHPPSGLTCPAAPDAYLGEDVVVAELRALRIEATDACRRVAAELVAAHEAVDDQAPDVAATATRANAIASNTGAADTKLGGIATSAQGADTKLGGTLQVRPEAGGPSTTVQLSAADRDRLAAGFDAQREGLWFLAGALVAVMAGLVLLRQVLPR